MGQPTQTHLQPSVNADFSNVQQGNQQQSVQQSLGANFSSLPSGHQQPRTVGEITSQQMGMPANSQSLAEELPSTVLSSNDQQSSFNTTFAGSQEGNKQPQATQPPAQMSISSNHQLQQQGQPSVPCPPKPPDDSFSSSALVQQSIPGSTVNGVDSFPHTSQMKNITPSTVSSGTMDPFDGLSLQPSNNGDTKNDTHNGNASEIIPSTHVKNAPTKYSIGHKIEYRDSSNNKLMVEIINVHLDDELVPFYTIKLPDGREKQTDDQHLFSNEDVIGG